MKSIFIGLLFNNEFDLLSVAVNMYLPHVSGIEQLHTTIMSVENWAERFRKLGTTVTISKGILHVVI